jgi:DNA-binding NtrC family response regulator
VSDDTTPTRLDIVALDDDADFREFLVSALEDDGHRVRAMGEPEVFYRACEQSLPDVVLLDMKMGRHRGEDVLSEVRRRWKGLGVIVVTGYPSLDSMRETFRQDVLDYLPKPFSLSDLRRALAQAASAIHSKQSPLERLRGDLGRRMREARMQRGWTLKELSEASGVSVSQLSSIERGAHLPSIESLVDVASALGQRPSAWLHAAGL